MHTTLTADISTLVHLIEKAKIDFVFEAKQHNSGMPIFTALCPVGEQSFLVRTPVNLLEKVPGFIKPSSDSGRAAWEIQEGEAILRVDTKVRMVEALKNLGVNPEQLKQVKTVKTSELRELVGEGATDKEEVESIVLRLQQKNDSIKLSVEDPTQSLGAYKGVRVTVEPQNYGHGLQYTLRVDCRDYLQAETVGYRAQIEAVNATILDGYLGDR